MTQESQIVLLFASLSGRNLQADFDGGTLSSDGGVLFFREIEAQIGIIGRLAGALDDPRDRLPWTLRSDRFATGIPHAARRS